MSSRRGRTPPQTWTPFERFYETTNSATGKVAPVGPGWELWANNLFTVHKRRIVDSSRNMPDLIHLSIRRKDRKTIRDWRHLQRIKNELVGPECEGVEVYPAESRLVDTSNQFHLWVFDDSTFRLPWGYGDRLVMTPDEVAEEEPGAVQRPFEQDPHWKEPHG